MKKMLIIIVMLVISITFVGCDFNSYNNDEQRYYLKENMTYDDIVVRVDSVTDTPYTDTHTNTSGFTIKVTFTLKNIGNKEFYFDADNFDIRTEDTNEKYDTEQWLFTRSLMAGGQATYWLEFITPYSLDQKKFVMYFDWGMFYAEQPYYLYSRALA